MWVKGVLSGDLECFLLKSNVVIVGFVVVLFVWDVYYVIWMLILLIIYKLSKILVFI